MTQSTNKKYSYDYPHAAITADCVIFGFDGEALKLLLIERGLQPYKGMWALPGGFMRIDETIERAAARELAEETGLHGIYMEQFKVFSKVDRDPRERVVTVAFIALVRPDDYLLTAGDDAGDARWFDAQMLPPMAFDHREIIAAARYHLREILRIRPVAFRLLDEHFTMPELQKVYEAIEGRQFDRRNFQRKALQSGIVVDANPKFSTIMCRPGSIDKTCSSLNEMSVIECEDATEPAPRKSLARRIYAFNKQKDENKETDEGSVRDLFNF